MAYHGLAQAATAKKHGVSEVTIWTWRRNAKSARRTAPDEGKLHFGPCSLTSLIRAEVQA